MIRRPPRSTRTDTLFPTRRSSDLRIRRTWTTFLFLLVMHEWNVASLTPSYSSGPCVPDVDVVTHDLARTPPWPHERTCRHPQEPVRLRSEEHTSELQSLMRISYAVFCLKNTTHENHYLNRK